VQFVNNDLMTPAAASTSPRRRGVLAALSAAAVLAVGACSGATGAFGGGFSVQDLLAELPMIDDGGLIAAGDLEAASAAAGLERPADAGADGAHDWIMGLTASTETGVFVPAPGDFLRSFGEEGGDELGWDLSDVHAFAHHEALPQQNLLVTGDFDGDTLSADLEDLGEGVYSAGTGEDFYLDHTSRSPVRPTGAPLRLARDGDRIMVSPQEQVVREWVAGEQGSTLADHEHVSDLAAALDDLGVYSAVLVTHEPQLQPVNQQQRERWEQSAIREPFSAIGVGWAIDDDDPVVRVAYHFDTAEAAERGADQVQRVWQEGATADGLPVTDRFALQQVDTDGAVVIADMHVAGDGAAPHAYHMLGARDVPFGYLP